MRKKIFLLTLLAVFVICFIPAFAGDITFQLDQREYDFPVGLDAIVPLKVNNTYNFPIHGTLSYTVSQGINRGNFSFTTSNTHSSSFTADTGWNTYKLNFGSSNKPTSFKVKLSFIYNDGKEDRIVELGDILIRFVSKKEDLKNEKNPMSSSSKPYITRQMSPFNDPFFNTDPFEEMRKFEQESDELFQRHMQQMQRMMQGQMPPVMQSPRGGLNETMPHNSSALKKQMEREMAQKRKMREEFQKNVKSSPTIQKRIKNLEKQGYTLQKETYNPQDSSNGTFNLEYKNKKGEKINIQGKMENGKVKDVKEKKSYDADYLEKQLRNDKRFQRLSSILEKKGYYEENIEINDKEDYQEAIAHYRNEKGEEAQIKATFKNGKVKSITLEGVKEEKNKIFLIALLTLPLLILIALLLYYLYRKLSKTQKQETTELPKEPEKQINYKDKAKTMLKEAQEYHRKGNVKEAFGKVEESLRFYLINKHKLGKELTCDELVEYLKNNGNNYKPVKECFDICTLVEFAKYKPTDGEFEKAYQTAQKIIG